MIQCATESTPRIVVAFVFHPCAYPLLRARLLEKYPHLQQLNLLPEVWWTVPAAYQNLPADGHPPSKGYVPLKWVVITILDPSIHQYLQGIFPVTVYMDIWL